MKLQQSSALAKYPMLVAVSQAPVLFVLGLVGHQPLIHSPFHSCNGHGPTAQFLQGLKIMYGVQWATCL